MNRLRFWVCLSASALLLVACGASTDDERGPAAAGGASVGGSASSGAGTGHAGAPGGPGGAASVGGASSAGGSVGVAGAASAGGGAAGASLAGGSGAGAAAGGGVSGSGAGGVSSGGRTGGGGAGAAAGGSSNGGGSSVVFPPNCKCLNLGPPSCTPTGHVTYTLTKAAAPTADQQSAYDAITCAMDGAVAYYNCNTTITKQLTVTYVPDVPTADGAYSGSIRFGGKDYMECATGMHEIAHAVGVGTAPKWGTYSVGGVFTGETAIAQLRTITGNAADVLHSDTQHFWPYGLNYASEAKSTADLVDHCLMVTAIRKDMGL